MDSFVYSRKQKTTIFVDYNKQKSSIFAFSNKQFVAKVWNGYLKFFTGQSDFLIDKKFTFEIGGKEKGKRQLAGLSDAYIAADNIEYGMDNKIPLWLFGFLY